MEAIQHHKITLHNDLELVSETAQFLAEQARIHCQFSEREEFHIFISLIEAINNAVVHGNLEVDSKLRLDGVSYEKRIEERRRAFPYRDRKVILTGDYSKDEVTFQIENEGPGFDASKIPDPTAEENLNIPSGRGLLIIRSFFDRVKFSSEGTSLTLVKKVRHPASQPLKTDSQPEMAR